MTTKVPCPHCGRPVEWSAASPFRPFCSKRCKLIDLGDWLAENHRIPASDDPVDEEPPPSEDTRPTH